MNKKLLAVIVTVAAVAIIAIIVVGNRKDDTSNTSTTMGSTSDDSQLMNKSDSAMPMPPPASSSDSSSGSAVEASSVTIENYNFTPAKIKVKKGTKVTWTNQDSVKHDVMPDNESDAFKASELLGKGESYSFTFNTVGTYTYHCSPHPYMKGTVEVVE